MSEKPNIEDIVYLITDIDQLARIITGFTVRKMGVVYELTCGVSTSWHYSFEFSTEKNKNNIGFK